MTASRILCAILLLLCVHHRYAFRHFHSRILRGLHVRKDVVNDDDNANVDFDDDVELEPVMTGLMSTIEDMEAGCMIEELGICMMVGPSLIAPGRGLYIGIDEDADSITIPFGTPICGYSRGTFEEVAIGDKAVGFAIDSVYAGIMYNKKLTCLMEVISDMMDKRDEDSKVPLEDMVFGHKLYFKVDAEKKFDDDNIGIRPIRNENGTANSNFIPFENEDIPITNMGMYANDLAFDASTTADNYMQKSNESNVLQLVWRMEVLDGVLTPTWPVVILSKDATFSNHDPMEIGLQYSWPYWNDFVKVGGMQTLEDASEKSSSNEQDISGDDSSSSISLNGITMVQGRDGGNDI